MVCLGAVSASASTISYDLTIDRCTGSCGTSPFGRVDLDDFGATGDVLVTVTLFNDNKFVKTGLDSTFDFNLIGDPTIAISGLTAGFSLVDTAPGDHHISSFGEFDYAIERDKNGGGNALAGPLSFHVLAANITIASFAELSRIPPGSDQAFFAADILSSQTGNTGAVGTGACLRDCEHNAVPEPASLCLFGTAALAAAARMRRRTAR
jgi:hypothetical protein